VEQIFIHLDRGLPVSRFDALGKKVVPVQSWFQAALILAARGDVGPDQLGAVARDVMLGAGMNVTHLANLTQDIVRRGHLSAEQAIQVISSLAASDAELEVVAHKRLKVLKKQPILVGAPGPARPDYVSLVKSWTGQA